MRTRPVYTEEFKADAVRLYIDGDRSVREVADALGVSRWTLREWYNVSVASKKKAQKPKLVAATSNETPERKLARLERENATLRKENDSLKIDREILKKAAAFFAKESE